MPETGQEGNRARDLREFPALLGLPLAEAEAALRKLARSYRVVSTAPPGRGAALSEELRVIGLREAEAEVVLVVAREVPASGGGPSDSPSGRK